MSKKNLKIWFSHDYDKLPESWEGSMAVLISVSNIDSKLLKSNPSFEKYDTKFRNENDFYPLNFEDGILLLFYHPGANTIFTTIRSFNPEKYQYYYGLIGEEFTLRRIVEK
jgi:hypothetical protein